MKLKLKWNYKLFNTKDDLLKGNIISSFFISMSFPVFQKTLISSVTSKYISINFIIICLGIILLGKLWSKYSIQLYRNYKKLIIIQNGLNILLVILLLLNLVDYKGYYIINTLLFVSLTKNILFGSNKLLSVRYNGADRNKYDNDILVTSNIANLVGYSISFIFNIPNNLVFILTAIGLIISGYYSIKAYNQQNIIKSTNLKINKKIQ